MFPDGKESVVVKLLMAPLLGALFVLFLPLAGFAMVAHAVWKRLDRKAIET
jgi:hypothetical protein